MQIYLSNKSGVPIYLQITDQIKDQILLGDLKPDQALPSIRGLAKDLRISVITTKRAYEDLEKSGYIYTMPGKGCFVAAQNPQMGREENLKKMEEQMDSIWHLAAQMNMSKEEVMEMFSVLWEEKS